MAGTAGSLGKFELQGAERRKDRPSSPIGGYCCEQRLVPVTLFADPPFPLGWVIPTTR